MANGPKSVIILYYKHHDVGLYVPYNQRNLRLHYLHSSTLRVAVADRPAQRRGSAHAEYSVPHHMVIKPFLLRSLAAKYGSRRWVWSTVVRRPSEVHDTHRRTKLTAPEMISSSRDMVSVHQNLNGPRDLTTPLSGMVCHPWASTCYHQSTYQI